MQAGVGSCVAAGRTSTACRRRGTVGVNAAWPAWPAHLGTGVILCVGGGARPARVSSNMWLILVRNQGLFQLDKDNMWSSWYEIRACLNSISITYGNPGTK